MIHGKLKCPACGTQLELSATKAPSQQVDAAQDQGKGESVKMDIGYLLDAINDDKLDGKNADFVADMREKSKKYGKVFMSPKMLAWLEKLAGVEDEGLPF